MKFSIARVCGLCLLFFGPAANADLTNDVHQIGIDLQTLLADLNTYSGTLDGDLVAIQNQLTNYLQPLHQDVVSGNNTLSSILMALNGSSDSSLANRLRDLQYMINGAGGLYQYENVFSYLNQIAQNTANVAPTNIYNVQVDARDILAGNPWWATNSAFVANFGDYSYAFPDDGSTDTRKYSFPQLFSLWSSRLQLKDRLQTLPSESVLFDSWGKSSWSTFGVNNPDKAYRRSYTWFDWVADATKSNLVIQGSVLDALRSMTNSPVSVSFEDVLAGNPYWATNSQFSPDWHLWGDTSPRPLGTPASFPEAFSLLLSSRLRMYHPEIDSSEYFDSWGLGGDNNTGGNNWTVYSFEDWIADYLKSNLVLTTSTSISNLNEELASTDYEDVQAPTNPPLPGYVDLVREADTSAGVSAIETGQTRVLNQVEALSGMLDSATPSSEIVVIPAMTVGGINVSEYRAELATSITPVAHRIMFFLWYVALYSSLFSLAQGEFAFYASLGRHWSVSHGALTERNN